MATLIDPEDLIVQYNIPHRDEKAFEGIFGKEVNSAKKIYIPAGDWELSRMLVVSNPVIIEGEGAGISNLIYNGTGPAIVLFFMDGVTTGSGIQNLTIKTENPKNNTAGVRIDSAELFFIRNTEFIGFNGNSGYGLLAQNSTRNLLIDNTNFSGNEIGIDLDAIQGATFKNLSLDNSNYNLRINDSGNILWQGGISKGEASSAGISITDGYSVTVESVEHNLDGYGVYAIETGGAENQSINIRGCSFYNTSDSKNYIDYVNVNGGTISENTFQLSSGDIALSIANSSNLTLGLQGGIYPNSPYLDNINSGYAWAFGDTEGSNTGAIDIESAPSQAVWYVDPVNGDDGGQGNTEITAIKTFAEFQKRVGANTLQQQTTIYLLNDSTEKVVITGGWPKGLWIWGVHTELATGTLTGVQAYSAPNTMGYLEDTDVSDWDTYQYNMIEITSGSASGTKAFIINDQENGRVRTSPLFNVNTFSIRTPSAGDTYRILRIPKVGGIMQNGAGNFGLVEVEVLGNSDDFLPAVRTEGNFHFYEHCLLGQEHFWHYTGHLQIFGCHSKLKSITSQVYTSSLVIQSSSWESSVRTENQGGQIDFRGENYFFGQGRLELREGGTGRFLGNSKAVFADKPSGTCISLEKNGLLDLGSNVQIFGNNITGNGLVATKGCSVEWPAGTNFDSIFQIAPSVNEVKYDNASTTFENIGSGGRLDSVTIARTQTVWYIDESSGDNSNDGATSGSALASYAEFERRIGQDPITTDYTINILGNITNDINVTLTSTTEDFSGTPNGRISFVGAPPTVLDTLTLSSVQAHNNNTQTFGTITVTGHDFTAQRGMRLEVTSGSVSSTKAYVGGNASSTEVAYTGAWWSTGAFSETAAPSSGDTVEVQQLVQLSNVQILGNVNILFRDCDVLVMGSGGASITSLDTIFRNFTINGGAFITFGALFGYPNNTCKIERNVHCQCDTVLNIYTFDIDNSYIDMLATFANLGQSNGSSQNEHQIDARRGSNIKIGPVGALCWIDNTGWPGRQQIHFHEGSQLHAKGPIWTTDWIGTTTPAWLIEAGSKIHCNTTPVSSAFDTIEISEVETTLDEFTGIKSVDSFSDMIRNVVNLTTTPYTPFLGNMVLADATSQPITINLPPVVDAVDNEITVKKIDSSGNAITIDGNGVETIDGQASVTITTQYESFTMISDGSEWWIK